MESQSLAKSLVEDSIPYLTADKNRNLLNSTTKGNLIRGASQLMISNSNTLPSATASAYGSSSSAYGPRFTRTKRFSISKDPDELGPPPGRYDLSLSWNVSTAVHMEPIHVEIRKNERIIPIAPGPGEYYDGFSSIADIANNHMNNNRNRKDIMINTSERAPLIPRHMIDKPGPGQYSPNTSLLKVSHNILLSGKIN